MDPKDNPDNKTEKNRSLPSYVFGEDYKQTVNLVNGDSNQESNELATEAVNNEPEKPPTDSIANENITNESVITSELEKLESEKPQQPTPVIATKKKTKRKTVVIGLIAFILVLAGVFVLFVLLNGGNHTLGASMELQCEMIGNNGELLNSGNATESKSSVEVSYSNGEFSHILQTFEASFEDSSTAKIAMSNVRSDYTKRFKSFGIATEPFKSEYNQNGASIKVTHYADTNMINSNNAGVLHIDINQNKVIIYDINTIKKNYEDLGYACSVK